MHLHKNRCIHVFAQKSLKLNITNIVNDTPHIILEKIDTHSLNGFTNGLNLSTLCAYVNRKNTIIVLQQIYVRRAFWGEISGYVYCTKLLYVRSRILETHKQIVKKKNMDCFIFNH